MERSQLGFDADDATRPLSSDGTGRMLAHRYRLDRRLSERPGSVTWQAFDEVLSRPVLAHVLTPGTPSGEAVLAAARRAAAATDSRFLRVLDAVSGDVPFIICESVLGVRLGTLLARGPLTALEAAHVVRDTADALGPMHARGIFHGWLNPETITITRTGNVKIAGFLIEAASASGGEASPEQWRDQEATDVLSMGKLLYACLVARWPIDPDREQTRQWGLAAAPLTSPAVAGEGRWVPPATLSARVPPTLDAICMQILAPRPGSLPLRTAREIVAALSRVLGNAEADDQLERRVALLMRRPAAAHSQERGSIGIDGQSAATTQPMSPATARAAGPAVSEESIGTATRMPAIDASPNRLVPPAHGRRPTPPPVRSTQATQGPPASSRGYRLARWLVPLFVTVMVVVSVAGMVRSCDVSSDRSSGSVGSTAHPGGTNGLVAPLAAEPQKVTEFDPVADGGEGAEKPSEVALATDQNPATAWHTQEYWGSPRMGNLKPGTGLLLDFGRTSTVRAVELHLVGSPTAVQLMVPKDDANPSAATVQDWTVAAVEPAAGESVTLTPGRPLTTRHLLVYLTSLPQIADGHYQGGIAEITTNP